MRKKVIQSYKKNLIVLKQSILYHFGEHQSNGHIIQKISGHIDQPSTLSLFKYWFFRWCISFLGMYLYGYVWRWAAHKLSIKYNIIEKRRLRDGNFCCCSSLFPHTHTLSFFQYDFFSFDFGHMQSYTAALVYSQWRIWYMGWFCVWQAAQWRWLQSTSAENQHALVCLCVFEKWKWNNFFSLWFISWFVSSARTHSPAISGCWLID